MTLLLRQSPDFSVPVIKKTAKGIGLVYLDRSTKRDSLPGKEQQNKEFSDESGLKWYYYGARMQDPQRGRFFSTDRFSEKYSSLSPYQYAANNPALNINVNGDSVWSTKNAVRNKNGTTVTTYTTHITGKVLNADNGPTDGLAQEINDGINSSTTPSVDSKGNTTIYKFDANYQRLRLPSRPPDGGQKIIFTNL